ncbi:MAG TPA: PilZ domain-containing protein [Anaeromyxobacter sp.]|nr:PilZ domain-containing protein [Anaeromyxobacter sp.]
MAQFIENPRRSPRAPVRCEGRVALREGGFWVGPTTDYGPRGCQLATPQRLEPAGRIFLELVNERVDGRCQLSGRIAWSSISFPWRSGIAFDDGSVRSATAFFERLAAAYPGLDVYGRTPERIPLDAPLAPAPPPASASPDLTPGEIRLMRAVGPGASLETVRAGLGKDVDGSAVLLFALLGRRYLHIGPPDPAASAAWAPILERAAAPPP